MENKTIDEVMKSLIGVLLLAWGWRCLSVPLKGWLFVFFYYPVLALLCLFVVIRLVQGLRHLAREKQWRKFVIILACTAMLALPWTSWYEDIRFAVLRPQMEAAAERIIAEQAEDKPEYQEVVHLPWYEFFLSRYWGRAVYYAQDDVVFFFSSATVMDNYAGYLYFPHGEHATTHSPDVKVLYDYYYGMDYYEDKGPHWEYCQYS